MERKILFFDIDGTLVSFQGKMPESTKRALKKARENGHLVAICSGRSVCQMDKWLLDLGFDGIVAASGAYVEYNGQVIYEHYMSEEALSAACTLLREADANFSAQTRNGMLVEEQCAERARERFRKMKERRNDLDRKWDAESCGRLDAQKNIQKLNFFDSKIPYTKIQEELSAYCDVTAMSFTEVGEGDGEICEKGINKALGMQKLIEHVGMGREDTIAFGDGPNDFEMVAYAQVGVAMGNAVDGLKEQADYVTDDIEADGVEKALRKFFIL